MVEKGGRGAQEVVLAVRVVRRMEEIAETFEAKVLQKAGLITRVTA